MIDFRSDTLTKPSTQMRQVMANAEVGDDVYGEDPTVNRLEQKVAALLGKEAAILCSSGTQSNLLGILSQCQRGEEYIVGAPYHTYKYEAGGAAVLGGVVPHTVPLSDDGGVDAQALRAAIKADDPHFPISRLISLENTHLGRVVPQQRMLDARKVADEFGLCLHLDGARLANAAVASGESMATLAAPFDTVSLCCSKGLGAPVGSLLAGSHEVIHKARRWRKMLGGGMRQAGVLAAAIDYALDQQMQRLDEDHAHAQRLALGIIGLPGMRVAESATNMLYLHFDRTEDAAKVSALAKAQGILVPAQADMRLVTHIDIDNMMIERAVNVLNSILADVLAKPEVPVTN
ncbi:MAG: low-specificity L-threonine aldolase [Idiomarina sp.]|nr:low-specificity L-threonine aldolase [Idiomarina sp.]